MTLLALLLRRRRPTVAVAGSVAVLLDVTATDMPQLDLAARGDALVTTDLIAAPAVTVLPAGAALVVLGIQEDQDAALAVAAHHEVRVDG